MPRCRLMVFRGAQERSSWEMPPIVLRGGWVGGGGGGRLKPGVLPPSPASVGVLTVHEGLCSLKILPIGRTQVTRDIGGGFVAQKSLLRICPWELPIRP